MTIYTVLATSALHEIDPWGYTRDVLAKIAGGWPQRELDALLPGRGPRPIPKRFAVARPRSRASSLARTPTARPTRGLATRM